MNIPYSPYIQSIHTLLKSLSITSQWVLFTPMVSIAHTIQARADLSHITFAVISGAHTNLFAEALQAFKARTVQGLIISYEQTLNFSKCDLILESIHEVDMLILDAMYRLDITGIYYAIELELMVKHVGRIKPKSLHTIQADNDFPLANNHSISLPQRIQLAGCNFNAMFKQIKGNKVLWVTQTWCEANSLSSWLTHYGVAHALLHRRVEEKVKVTSLMQFSQSNVSHGIITVDTLLPLTVQDIDTVIFTFMPQSDHILYALLPYCSPTDTTWMCMPWFLPQPYHDFVLPYKTSINDVIHMMAKLEAGCTMREAERVINSDSYHFEKVIKYLKGKDIIHKVGLKYHVKQSYDVSSLLHHYSNEITYPLRVAVVNEHVVAEKLDEGITFAFQSRKIVPVGIYAFSQVPPSLLHEVGHICTSGYNLETINAWIKAMHLDSIIVLSSRFTMYNSQIHLPVYYYPDLDYRELSQGLNPYQGVTRAKNVIGKLPNLSCLHHQRVGVVFDHYNDGWSALVMAIALKQEASDCLVFPLWLTW